LVPSCKIPLVPARLGISTSNFPEALACLGHDGAGLSPTSVVRMKEIWGETIRGFFQAVAGGKPPPVPARSADGIYFNIRLSDDRPCVNRAGTKGILQDGTKELIAMVDGERESEQSWLGC